MTLSQKILGAKVAHLLSTSSSEGSEKESRCWSMEKKKAPNYQESSLKRANLVNKAVKKYLNDLHIYISF